MEDFPLPHMSTGEYPISGEFGDLQICTSPMKFLNFTRPDARSKIFGNLVVCTRAKVQGSCPKMSQSWFPACTLNLLSSMLGVEFHPTLGLALEHRERPNIPLVI